MDTDVFICHASEDKEAVARPLAEELTRRGFTVWFDELILRVGDSLKSEIDKGLARCNFGLVILSRNFLSKQWPKRELEGLNTREMLLGRKVILPVWHEITATEVMKFSPSLADKLAISTSEGIDSVASKIEDVLRSELTKEKLLSVVNSAHLKNQPQEGAKMRRYLSKNKEERLTELRSIADVYCGMDNDLWVIPDAIAFLEEARKVEGDPEVAEEISRLMAHVESQARMVAAEMEQDNPPSY